jgi:hypothetical protein
MLRLEVPKLRDYRQYTEHTLPLRRSRLSVDPTRMDFSICEHARNVNGQSRYEVGMRLKDKIAIVVGAGQSPGEGLGNGRATVLRFAREGAKVLAVDNNFASAEETVAMAQQSGGECLAFKDGVIGRRLVDS